MCVCVCVLMCERGSVLTPLRGGLVRDSMETLSEAVSVRERKRKVQREKDGKKGREKGTDGEKESSEGEERKRCVTSDDNALCLSPVILGGGADVKINRGGPWSCATLKSYTVIHALGNM